jgi:hypothetical protein
MPPVNKSYTCAEDDQNVLLLLILLATLTDSEILSFVVLFAGSGQPSYDVCVSTITETCTGLLPPSWARLELDLYLATLYLSYKNATRC